MHVARVNTLMNGAPLADLKVMDTLSPLGSLTGGVMQGLPDYRGFYPGGLTMILTNPPFGSKVTNQRMLADFAGRDGVTRKNGRVVPSLLQEVAFINRCLEFLAPSGKLGIVLPDSVLANSTLQPVRDWILRWAKLKAVVSLPSETFVPFGANVKASVVFLEKRHKPLPPTNYQPELWQEFAADDTDYGVYMARIDNIGYDATGRLSVLEEESHEPFEVKETIFDFAHQLGW
jgi:type I restriction enzyme M protein